MRHEVRWRRRACLLGLTGGFALCSLAPTQHAGAAALVSFRATASADGLRQTVLRPDAPITSQLVDSALPSAQASLDNLGNSIAYGSFIFPGDLVVGGPGLVSGVSGVSIPSYPVLAQSSDPGKPKADASAGPVVSHAESTPTSSVGTATFTSPSSGVGKLEAIATVTGNPAGGTLKSVATSEATAISLAGVLTLSGVKARAEVAYANGKITPTSSIAVSDVMVAGIRLVLTPKGLTLPGTTIALPDTSALLKPLAAAGLSLSLVAAEPLVGGIRSGGLRIVEHQDTPDGSSVTTTSVFGQVLALATATSDDSVVETPPFVPPVVAPPVTGSVTPPLTGGGEPVLNPPTPPDLGTTAPVPPAVSLPGGSAVAAVPAAGSIPFARMDTLSFYLVLVLAGAVALAAQKAMRRFGVSSTWTS